MSDNKFYKLSRAEFFTYLKKIVLRTFNFRGAACKKELFVGLVANLVIGLTLNISGFGLLYLVGNPEKGGTGSFVVASLLLVFHVVSATAVTSLNIRRLHDMGRSGWEYPARIFQMVLWFFLFAFALLGVGYAASLLFNALGFTVSGGMEILMVVVLWLLLFMAFYASMYKVLFKDSVESIYSENPKFIAHEKEDNYGDISFSDIPKYFKKSFIGIIDYYGEASRKELLIFLGLNFAFYLSVGMFNLDPDIFSIIAFIFALMYPAILIRRLHDMKRSGWELIGRLWVILMAVGIGVLLLFVLIPAGILAAAMSLVLYYWLMYLMFFGAPVVIKKKQQG